MHLQHQPDGGEGRRGAGGGHAGGEHEPRGRVLEVLYKGLAAGDVPPSAGEGVADGPHPNVDVTAVHAEVLPDAAAAGPEDANGVRLVDHQEGIVLLLDLRARRRCSGGVKPGGSDHDF